MGVVDFVAHDSPGGHRVAVDLVRLVQDDLLVQGELLKGCDQVVVHKAVASQDENEVEGNHGLSMGELKEQGLLWGVRAATNAICQRESERGSSKEREVPPYMKIFR